MTAEVECKTKTLLEASRCNLRYVPQELLQHCKIVRLRCFCEHHCFKPLLLGCCLWNQPSILIRFVNWKICFIQFSAATSALLLPCHGNSKDKTMGRSPLAEKELWTCVSFPKHNLYTVSQFMGYTITCMFSWSLLGHFQSVPLTPVLLTVLLDGGPSSSSGSFSSHMYWVSFGTSMLL